MSKFFDQVYAVVQKIPLGRITSYGAIARYLGHPQSARMVGYAMNASLFLSFRSHLNSKMCTYGCIYIFI